MAKKKLSNSQFNLTQNTIKYLNVFDLNATAKLVLVYLTTFYNPDKKEFFPKYETIIKALGISERSVTRAMVDLYSLELVKKRRPPYSHNFYQFTDKFFELVHFVNLKERRTDKIDYALWREAVYTKYEGTCQLCGAASGPMHAHHKKEYSKNPDKRYAIDNGILPCESCHKKLHPWMKD